MCQAHSEMGISDPMRMGNPEVAGHENRLRISFTERLKQFEDNAALIEANWQAVLDMVRAATSPALQEHYDRRLVRAEERVVDAHKHLVDEAKLRRDAGESIEEVSRFLDHSSLAVTTTYLRRLEGQEDRSGRRVAEALGL